MREENTCGGCAGCGGGSCGGCGACGSGSLFVTPGELELLQRFAQTPFLPVGFGTDPDVPVYREETGHSEAEYARSLLGLRLKGLIRLDREEPLQNFDYRAYSDCPYHGSAALTALGQQAVELVEIQGVEP